MALLSSIAIKTIAYDTPNFDSMGLLFTSCYVYMN